MRFSQGSLTGCNCTDIAVEERYSSGLSYHMLAYPQPLFDIECQNLFIRDERDDEVLACFYPD